MRDTYKLGTPINHISILGHSFFYGECHSITYDTKVPKCVVVPKPNHSINDKNLLEKMLHCKYEDLNATLFIGSKENMKQIKKIFVDLTMIIYLFCHSRNLIK